MKCACRGVTLIELLIALAILGVLLALGVPSFTVGIANSRIRTTAEAIQNGLQLARAEAVKRNALIRFQLTSDLSATCVLSTTASNWIVSYDNAAGLCASAFIDEGLSPDLNAAPRIIQRRGATEGSRGAVIAADQSEIIFNGFGRVTNAATNPVGIAVMPISGVCTTQRCLNVTVSAGGQVRMCDPQLTLTNPNDPQSC